MSQKKLALTPQNVDVTPMGMLQIAVAQGADIDKLAKLMELQERWESNEARKAFHAAMARFKDNPPQISKNRHVMFGNTEYNHATLDHVTDQITKALSAVGISHKWEPQQNGAEIAVTCILTHEMGHKEATTLKASADSSGSKNAIQAIGSTVTYLQRYTLLAAVGMAAAGQDDDGKASGVPEDKFAALLLAIETAKDVDELKMKYFEASRLAEEKKDKGALNSFVKARDKRYKEVA